MVRRTIMLTLLIGSCFTSGVFAADPNCRDAYIVPGRAAMFEGSLSGLREAYTFFNAGVQDTSKCTGDRELIFLHALTQTAILFIDDSNLLLDTSFLELAKEFGVDVPGDSFEFPDIFKSLGINVPLDPNGCYKIPPGAPNADEISDMIHNSIIPEINDINAELDSISDTASNRFRIFFHHDETGLDNDLEVDYGEVLILKGMLLAFKSQLESKLAYDVFVDVNETLLHKLLYEDGINPEEPDFAELAASIGIADPNNISINDDFLNPYPNLLKVLPTANDSNNGTAILAKSKKDLLASIENYFKAVNYIAAETDNQNDDLVYIDPNDEFVLDTLNQKLTTLQNSLKNGTAATYPLETTKTYNVYDSNSKLIGQMVLVYDLTSLGGDANSLTFTKTGVPTPWEVDWFGISGGTDLHKNTEFEADLECYSSGHWWGGYLDGTYNNNGNITDVTFEYWGESDGILEGLKCNLVSTKVANITVNLNPIFGSSPPVNPRDLLPQFDANNQPLAGTFGDGLGDDATLGGILPGKTQQDWINLLHLPPASMTVLNIVGKTAADANTAIVNANLKVDSITTAYNNTVAAGKVISQSPAAGKKVAIGSAVSYVKSLGKPVVPNVVGMTAPDANTAITSVDNLKVGTVTTAYDNNDAGKVISQNPAAGKAVTIGSAVNYVKSLGPKPTLSIAATDSEAGEPANTGTFTISRTGSTAGPLTVYFKRSGTAKYGAAGDYTLSTLLATSVVIPIGQPSVDITVTPVDNLLAEPNETVILTLKANAAYNLSSTLSERTATVTILDNEPTISVTASDSQAGEPNNTGTFTISRTGSTAGLLTVYFTRSGTAKYGAAGDYTLSTLLAKSVVIPIGQPSVDITVSPVDNLVAEPNETVILTLKANAAYNLPAVVAQRSATVTILDNEPK